MIVAKTKHYIIATKSCGQLSQRSSAEDGSLQASLAADSKASLHILTRLDRPVSGLVLFSMSKVFTKNYLHQQILDKVTKVYLAIVERIPAQDTFTMNHYLFHDKKTYKSHVSDLQHDNYKLATSTAKVLYKYDNYALVRIKIHKGSFHQIRSQLAHIGHPVKGDVKYGARRGNKDRSIHLHSYKLKFTDLNKVDQEYTTLPNDQDTLWTIAKEYIS